MIFDLTSYENIDVKNYSDAGLLSETDFQFIELAEHYGTLSSGLKQIFREDISQELNQLLLVFAERIASYLINENNQKLFQVGLHSLDVCMERAGTHDIFPILALYYDVYKRHMFMFADFLSSEEPIGKALQVFLYKDDEGKSIGAMNYIIEHNALGQVFFKKR